MTGPAVINEGRTFTKRNEGLTLGAVLDRNGKYECGWGCQGPDVVATTVWDLATAMARFDVAYANATQDAAALCGHVWAGVDPVRQAALIDMAYEMGMHGLAQFDHMLAAIDVGDYDAAADGCIASAYAREVPARAGRCAYMLRTGSWPAPF